MSLTTEHAPPLRCAEKNPNPTRPPHRPGVGYRMFRGDHHREGIPDVATEGPARSPRRHETAAPRRLRPSLDRTDVTIGVPLSSDIPRLALDPAVGEGPGVPSDGGPPAAQARPTRP